MKLSDCFVMEAFNELINFPFEDVRAAFNQFDCYVAMGKEESFVKEVVHIKNWYSEELKKIEKYMQEEYTDLVNSGEDIPEYDEPSFMIKEVEIQVKSKMIEIISKYFDRDVFEKSKTSFFKHEVFREQSVETPHELWVSLNVHKKHTYSLLSMLGFYQRHYRYFLSSSDYYKICAEYSRQVYRINKDLGLNFEFTDIFIGDKRLDKKYIDIDKLSLIGLLQPYLKHNTNEIKQIIDIMMRNLRGRHGGLAWDSAQEEVKQFITECEAKGIMKRL